jgi:hypothetical protein
LTPNNLKWMHNESKRQAQFLEITCWKISGAVAEFFFDEYDYYGNLGLGDIEGSYDYLSAYESSHNIRHDRVLAGCTVVVEQLLSKHREVAEAMLDHVVGTNAVPAVEHLAPDVAADGTEDFTNINGETSVRRRAWPAHPFRSRFFRISVRRRNHLGDLWRGTQFIANPRKEI